jgi:hypothetical protein
MDLEVLICYFANARNVSHPVVETVDSDGITLTYMEKVESELQLKEIRIAFDRPARSKKEKADAIKELFREAQIHNIVIISNSEHRQDLYPPRS